ncbi:hypothetical protein MJG53_010039 [Ovis ammon polii x Ovis aries]|uniref:Uncharacterized protein n=1 Tax=Ovis ammon polii x Ovis aries TaxID=2918886 RepID=A0ACB9UVG1_9CETA|nr:hypothetical protein MJG53_010039 [Ovis ammon polii x Ovis aries]
MRETRAQLPGGPGPTGEQPGANIVGQNEFREKTLEDDRQPETPEQHLHYKGALSPVQEAPAQDRTAGGHCWPRKLGTTGLHFQGSGIWTHCFRWQ